MKALRFSQSPELNAEMISLYKLALTALAFREKDVQAEYEKRRRVWNDLGIFSAAGLLRAFGVPTPTWAKEADRDHG